jgi:hypothetical protein
MLNFRHSFLTGQRAQTLFAASILSFSPGIPFLPCDIALSGGKNNSVFIPAHAAIACHIGKS